MQSRLQMGVGDNPLLVSRDLELAQVDRRVLRRICKVCCVEEIRGGWKEDLVRMIEMASDTVPAVLRSR